MALQTSGAISLSQIHVEAGGASTATASLNDSDIRGLIGKGSGVTMSFSEWYGASNSSWVIDEGQSGTAYGYGVGYGSITNNTWRGAFVQQVATFTITIKGSSSYLLSSRIQGNRASNWFTSVVVGNYQHSYSSFSRSYSGGYTSWIKSISSAQAMNGVGNTSGSWT